MKAEKQITQTLSNGLPLYKLMRYKVTKEKCRIIKVNPEVFETNIGFPKTLILPLSVNVKITRIVSDIPFNIVIENISQYDLEVWNERMNPSRIVNYRTRKGQFRNEVYANKE